MATWAKGFDFKNSGNTTRIGGIGTYGTDTAVEKIYIGLGSEPWNNAGLQITSSAINFKGNKIYHAGDKPTPSDIGAATSSHTHNYAGSSSAGGNANAAVKLATARKLTIGSTGKNFDGSGDLAWSLTEIGAAAASHTHSYLPLSGGTVTGETVFNNYLSVNAWPNYGTGKAQLWFDGNKKALMLQPSATDIIIGSNYVYHAGRKPTVAEIGAAASSHTHNYAPTSTGGNITLHADSDASSTGEYALIKAGHNELKVASSAGGTTVTRGADKLTFNGSVVYHTGYKPSKSDVGLGSVNNWGASSSISANSTSEYATTNMVAQVRAEKANASHTHNYAGSSSAGGAATSALTCTGNSATATTSNYLTSNTRMDYGWNGINYFNISGTAGSAAKANDTPTTAWWHVMRFNHANSTGFYTDLAVPFNDTSLYYKRVTSGAVQNGGWIRVLDALNYNSYAPTKTGSGASGTWGISVTGSSASCTGNAATATKLQTARTINGTNFDGTAAITTANWGTARTITIGNTGKSVNGSGNVAWTLSEIGAAAASHTHSYAATSHNHGLLHDNFTVTLANTTTDSGWSMINSSYNGFLLKSIRTQASTPNWIVNNYGAGIAFGGSDTKGVISTAYNTPSIKFAGGNGTAPTWWIGITGNSGATYNLASLAANTANTLATARTINGTSFNGSASITTANWGTARTLTIGSTGKSVNGSGNVSWSLSEIGAAAASHTHSYLPLSGGTMTGTIAFSSAKIQSSTTTNTLHLVGSTDSTMGALKLGTGGCRIYGLGTAERLYVEGGIYTNKNVECGAEVISNGSTYPGKSAQAGWDIGLSTRRWYTLYAVNTNLSSDKSMKEDIAYVNKSYLYSRSNELTTPFKDFLCNELKIATYKYKRTLTLEDENGNEVIETVPHEPEDNQIGFIAQDIRNSEIGSLFVYGEDGNMSYSPTGFTAVIAQALQEEIISRDAEIQSLKEQNELLLNKIAAIEEKLGL